MALRDLSQFKGESGKENTIVGGNVFGRKYQKNKMVGSDEG